jgi:hypothetical protein
MLIVFNDTLQMLDMIQCALTATWMVWRRKSGKNKCDFEESSFQDEWLYGKMTITLSSKQRENVKIRTVKLQMPQRMSGHAISADVFLSI